MRTRLLAKYDALSGWQRVLALFALACVIAVGAIIAARIIDIFAAQAFAGPGDAEKIGENTGGLLTVWAVALYGGVVGIISIILLIRRDYAELAIFAAAALLVAGFVFVPDTIGEIFKSIWSTVSSGTGSEGAKGKP